MRKSYSHRVLFLSICLLLFLTGCFLGQERDTVQSEADLQDRPILILHRSNSLLLAQFENAYPEVEIEAVDMSNLGSGDPYENCERKYGTPDIVLLDQRTGGLDYYYEEDRLEDLWEASTFGAMPEEYTAYGLLDAMNQELDKAENRTDFTVLEISEEYNDNLMEKYESCYEEVKRLID